MTGTDERGQAIQIGAVILFSFLVIAFSLYQATAVPNQNRQVEFDHSQQVQQNMLELRNGILSTAQTGFGTPVAIPLGAAYPARAIAVNPGRPSGSLRTFDPGGESGLVISNAMALTGGPTNYWNGSDHSYLTTGIRYSPNYNFYTQAPTTVYENGLVYNRGPDDGVSVQTDQRLIEGRELDLTVLQGSYQRSLPGAVSVDVRSPSNTPRTVTVQASDGPITLTIPTDLSQSRWRTLLESQRVASGGYIESVDVGGGLLTIELQETRDGSDVLYELRVPVAGVGSGVSDPTAQYITAVSGNGTSVPERGVASLVAEVRNGFNGPESGVEVTASVDGDGSISCSGMTDDEGRIDCVYTSPNNINSATTVEATLEFGDGSSAARSVIFEIYQNTNGSGGPPNNGGNNGNSGETGNPDGSASQIQYNGDAGPYNGGDTVEFTVDNNGTDDVTIEKIAINTDAANTLENPSSGQPEIEVSGSTTGEYIASDGIYRLGNNATLTPPATIAGGESGTFRFQNFKSRTGNGGGSGAASDVDVQGEQFTVTLYFSDGSTRTISFQNGSY